MKVRLAYQRLWPSYNTIGGSPSSFLSTVMKHKLNPSSVDISSALARSPSLHPCSLQMVADCEAVDAEPLGQGVGTVAGLVRLDELAHLVLTEAFRPLRHLPWGCSCIRCLDLCGRPNPRDHTHLAL